MATITITIPAAITARVIDGFAKRFNYSPMLEDGSINPESKSAFAKRKLIEYIKRAVKESEIETAANLAATTAGSSVDTEITLT